MFVVYRNKQIVYLGNSATDAVQCFTHPTIGDALHNIKSLDELQASWNQIYNKVWLNDLVQWNSQGVDQFDAPKKVTKVCEDGKFVWVEGSDTGIPTEQVVVIKKHYDYKIVENSIEEIVKSGEQMLKQLGEKINLPKAKQAFETIKSIVKAVK